MQKKKLNPKALSRLGQTGTIFGIGAMQTQEVTSQNLFIVSADYAKPAGMSRFINSYPNNFINVGIAEQNLIGISAGISNEGYRVVASAQSCFLSMRCFEQVRQFCGYMKYPLILVGVSSGFALTFFGNTHYSLEDLAILRNVKGLNIFTPSDAVSALSIFEYASNLDEPSYIRCTGGVNTPIIYNETFDVSKGFSSLITGDDILIISSGNITINALRAAEKLNDNKISTEFIDLHSLWPISPGIFNNFSKYKLVVTIEEHFNQGGLGSIVKEVMQDSGFKNKLLNINVGDKYVVPGDYEYLINESGLSDDGIYHKVFETFKKIKL